jgi:hypothetical protein
MSVEKWRIWLLGIGCSLSIQPAEATLNEYAPKKHSHSANLLWRKIILRNKAVKRHEKVELPPKSIPQKVSPAAGTVPLPAPSDTAPQKAELPKNKSSESAPSLPSKESQSPAKAGASVSVTVFEKEFRVPAGFKIHNVPGDGLCGYWATLAAKKAKEEGSGTPIRVTRKEIFELLKRLADRIAHTIKKADKTEDELAMIEEIDQLIRDGYSKDYENLFQRIEGGQMQLDSPLATFLALEIGHNIALEWEGQKNGKKIHVREWYKSDDSSEAITIYYSGNGSGGHYQVIVPRNISVTFN